jgi:hypothetical protein
MSNMLKDQQDRTKLLSWYEDAFVCRVVLSIPGGSLRKYR